MTLVEMLISMAVTLVMMAAVVNLFANIGSGVRIRRASMELGSELRLARARLFKDLAGATCAARPKLPSDDHDDGYLEIIEGFYSDKSPSALLDGDPDNGELDYTASIVPSGGDPSILVPSTSTRIVAPGDITNGGGLGDYDDILALTVRSESEPFVGSGRVFNNGTNLWEDGTIESDLAEIIWYAVENPADIPAAEPGMRTIYRRVLLIAPWIDLTSVAPVGTTDTQRLKNFYDRYDISVRIAATTPGNFIFVPNNLSDLTKRENRFAHRGLPPNVNDYPWAIDDRRIRFQTTADNPLWPLEDERQGEDVMLNDVLAFDLRVFDPGAPLYSNANTITEPSDAGWVTGGAAQGYGAFVDLGWLPSYTWTASEPEARFYSQHQAGWHPEPASPPSLLGYPCVYDTWPYHYENDGINQDGDFDAGSNPLIDEGTDGLDTANASGSYANGVDDSGERETSPPYDTPLRGIQVKIRVYDRDSRQIREATVTRNFVPQ